MTTVHEMDSDDQATVLSFHEVALVFNEGRPTEGRALHNVSFQVKAMDIVGVLGPSGSGKTSLLEVAAGLRQPTCGSIRLVGNELAGLSKNRIAAIRRQSVRFVFQSDNLVPYLSALENVLIMGRISTGTKMDPVAALALLDKLDISPSIAQRLPRELSGGQQQRVAIARALVGSPSLTIRRLMAFWVGSDGNSPFRGDLGNHRGATKCWNASRSTAFRVRPHRDNCWPDSSTAAAQARSSDSIPKLKLSRPSHEGGSSGASSVSISVASSSSTPSRSSTSMSKVWSGHRSRNTG